MRKVAFGISGLTAVFGLAGLLLRRAELARLYTDGTGLADKWTSGTILLTAFTAAALAVAALMTAWLCRSCTDTPEYERAFHIGSPVLFGLYAVLAAVVTVAAVLHWRQDTAISAAVGFCFLLFAAGSGISVLVRAVSAWKGKRGGLTLASVVPAVFACLWLVLTYKENDRNPQMVEYVFACLALAAMSVSFYYSAGYAFSKRGPGRLIFTHMIAVYFTLVTLADSAWSASVRLLLGALACVLLLDLYTFVSNLTRKSARHA